MMYNHKRRIVTMIIVMLMFSSPLAIQATYYIVMPEASDSEAEHLEKSALLLYTANADEAVGKEELVKLHGLLRMYCNKVRMMDTRQYLKGALREMPYVFIMGDSLGELQNELLEDLQGYAGVLFWIGKESCPYPVSEGLPVLSSTMPRNEAEYLAFLDTLNQVFEVQPEIKPSMYIRLDHISPLNDFEKIEEVVLWLKEQGVPFLMALKPIFFNTEYEHMKKYYRLLRWMQEMGGTAVLSNIEGWRSPNSWDETVEAVPVFNIKEGNTPKDLLALSLKAYVDHGIYPVAFSGTQDVFFDTGMATALTGFSTFIESGAWQGYFGVMKLDEEWKGHFIPLLLQERTQSIGGNVSFKLEDQGIKRATSNPYVLGFDGYRGWESLKQAVLQLKASDVQMVDFRKLAHQVILDNLTINVHNEGFWVNGKEMILALPHQDTEVKEMPEKHPVEVTGLNKRIKQIMLFVGILVGIFFVIFLMAFISGKRIDRRKHLR